MEQFLCSSMEVGTHVSCVLEISSHCDGMSIGTNRATDQSVWIYDLELPLGIISIYDFSVVGVDEHVFLRVTEESFWSSTNCKPTCLSDSIVELCAGVGGMGVGAAFLGGQTVLSVDFNGLSCKHLHANQHGQVLQLDITQPDSAKAIHRRLEATPGTVTFGFPCQPFSTQGMNLGSSDSRFQVLISGLKIIYLCQTQAAILECVPAAGENPDVQKEVQILAHHMNFDILTTYLDLQDQWPCCRSRWWAILLPKAWNTYGLRAWPKSSFTKVSDLFKSWGYWSEPDESDLQLTESELVAYSTQLLVTTSGWLKQVMWLLQSYIATATPWDLAPAVAGKMLSASNPWPWEGWGAALCNHKCITTPAFSIHGSWACSLACQIQWTIGTLRHVSAWPCSVLWHPPFRWCGLMLTWRSMRFRPLVDFRFRTLRAGSMPTWWNCWGKPPTSSNFGMLFLNSFTLSILMDIAWSSPAPLLLLWQTCFRRKESHWAGTKLVDLLKMESWCHCVNSWTLSVGPTCSVHLRDLGRDIVRLASSWSVSAMKDNTKLDFSKLGNSFLKRCGRWISSSSTSWLIMQVSSMGPTFVFGAPWIWSHWHLNSGPLGSSTLLDQTTMGLDFMTVTFNGWLTSFLSLSPRSRSLLSSVSSPRTSCCNNNQSTFSSSSDVGVNQMAGSFASLSTANIGLCFGVSFLMSTFTGTFAMDFATSIELLHNTLRLRSLRAWLSLGLSPLCTWSLRKISSRVAPLRSFMLQHSWVSLVLRIVRPSSHCIIGSSVVLLWALDFLTLGLMGMALALLTCRPNWRLSLRLKVSLLR